MELIQPPSGGCVLKLPPYRPLLESGRQPPSGGCVLKHRLHQEHLLPLQPAAFRRLCVETGVFYTRIPAFPPAAFRRLCVETLPPYLMPE